MRENDVDSASSVRTESERADPDFVSIKEA